MQEQEADTILVSRWRMQGYGGKRTIYGNKGDLPRHICQLVPGVFSSVDPIVNAGPY
jgi:hypothetical protein